jgi:CheY-like chemotaxis protein
VRLLLCDDDAHVRVVLTSIANARGHEVVGEADTTLEALDLLARVSPDAVIVDLALRVGSGSEILVAAAEHGCQAIVFSAYVDSLSGSLGSVVAVSKPDFGALEAALDALASRVDGSAGWAKQHADRRTGVSAQLRPAPVSPVSDATDFYRALGDAWAGDTLMAIEFDDARPDAATTLSPVVRGVIRAQDHLMQSRNTLLVFLLGGGPDAAAAVAARFERVLRDRSDVSPWMYRHAVIESHESASDAFQRVRTGGADTRT